MPSAGSAVAEATASSSPSSSFSFSFLAELSQTTAKLHEEVARRAQDACERVVTVSLPQEQRPADNVPLTSWDTTMLGWSSVTTCTLYDGLPDVDRFLGAFERVVRNNPILAGRLVDVTKPKAEAAAGDPPPRQIEVTFRDGAGSSFVARKLSSEQEQRLGTMTADADGVIVHAEALQDLFEELELPEPGSGEEQIADDNPLVCMTVYVGRRCVAVLAAHSSVRSVAPSVRSFS